jgi:predicted lactoylglutathione lyase
MARKLFVNIAVKDLQRSVDFYTKLGYTFDQQFTDENATCMIIGEDAYAMLLVEGFFAGFTPRQICDTTTHHEALLCVSAESRDEVDSLVDTALAEGGSPAKEAQDHGFMYSRSFLDPDGHLWEVLHMDPSALEQQQDGAAQQ